MKALGILLVVSAVALGVAGMLLAKRPIFYSASAMVKVARDKLDLPELTGVANPAASAAGGVNNAFFMETEIAVVKSDATLNPVIEQLKLNEAWGQQLNRGNALATSETLLLLKERLRPQAGSEAGLIQITALSDIPAEAADIANAVAHSYCRYRTDYRRRLVQTALNAVAEKHAEMEKEISASRANMEQTWQQLDPAMQELAATNASTIDNAMVRALHTRFSDSLLRYLAASNQLALFPLTNAANAEIIEHLKSRADKTRAEMIEAENSTRSEMRRVDQLQNYQTARLQFEELTQRFARLKSTVEDLQNNLRPQSQPPASVVEPATVPTSPDARNTNRTPWLLPAAGVAFLLGVGLLIARRSPRKAAV